ncbi:MAG: hypothetical protein AAF633_13530 [Chloroflexota bacterium]
MSQPSSTPSLSNTIGTLNEKPLHAALKQHYALPGDRFEVPVEKYVIDILRPGAGGDLLIEIQTGSFVPLKKKLRALLPNHQILLIYPIPLEKWLVTIPQNGRLADARRRKSPKRGSVLTLFHELVYIPDLLSHPNFLIEVAMTREEEVRQLRQAPKRRRRGYGKGWTLVERRLLEVADRHLFKRPQDLLSLLPEGLPEPFTTGILAKRLGRPRSLAQKMVYALRHMGAVEAVGKEGRSVLYVTQN